MAMDGDALGGMIKGKVSAISNITDDAELTKFCNAVGEAIVDYLKSSAIVTGEVTSGAGAGGQVTGTLT